MMAGQLTRFTNQLKVMSLFNASKNLLNSFVQFGLSRSISTKNAVAKQKAEYKKQMTELRKSWTAEFERKASIKAEAKRAFEQKVVYTQAINLRKKREVAIIKTEEMKKKRAEQAKAYSEKVARNHVLAEEKNKVMQERYRKAIADLELERPYWITLENMDSKITESLFENQASTGLTYKHSKLWRYALSSFDINHMIKTGEINSDFSLKERQQAKDQMDLVERMEAREFLDQAIGSASERANYNELLEEFLFHTKNSADNFESAATMRDELDVGGYQPVLKQGIDPDDESTVEEAYQTLDEFGGNPYEFFEDPAKGWELQPGDVKAPKFYASELEDEWEEEERFQQALDSAEGSEEEGYSGLAEEQEEFEVHMDEALGVAVDEGDYKKVASSTGSKRNVRGTTSKKGGAKKKK